MSTAISVEHLAYSYPGVDDTPGVAVFKDLSLQIEQGTFVAILGGNGCGKSTLLRAVNLMHNLYPNIRFDGDIHTLYTRTACAFAEIVVRRY